MKRSNSGGNQIILDANQKIYILDTSVFIDDPHAFERLGEDNIVVVPIWIFEELDRFKKDPNSKGFSAREASRILSDYVKDGDVFNEGVPLNGNGKLYFRFFDPIRLKKYGLEQKNDNKIVLLARILNDSYPGKVIMVSNDVNMRMMAKGLGVKAEVLKSVRVDFSLNEFLWKEVPLSEDKWKNLFEAEKKKFTLEDLQIKKEPFPNEVIVVANEAQTHQKIFLRWQKSRDGTANFIKQNLVAADEKLGFELKNEQQKIAACLLGDDRISILALFGKTGGGKSLLASAYGLKSIEGKKYHKIIVYRTNHCLGRDLGAMPGDLEEKFSVWAQPAIDCMKKAYLLQTRTRRKNETPPDRKKAEEHISKMMKEGVLEIKPISFIRGGTIENALIIIDEPQNMTRHEIKTLLTRKGEGSKMILTGDVTQIDNDYVDLHSNGFSHALHLLKGEEFFSYLQFLKSERSSEVERIAELFEKNQN